MSSYYRLLGVSRHADLDEIRQAYWALSRRVRRSGGRQSTPARLTEIRRAYETLSDLSRRRAYDARQFEPQPVRSARIDETRRVDGSFENDVAKEFPSMAALGRIVPRMREAFFGRRSEVSQGVRTVRVALTPHEAYEGVRLPLAVSFRPDCPVCGGRGEIWSERCGVCTGTGSGRLTHEVTLPVPAGVHDGECLRFSVVLPFGPETQIQLQITIQ